MPQIRAVMSGRLGERAPAQERLVEPWRLVDPQLHVGHHAVAVLDVHRTLALDARQRSHVHDLTAVGELVAHPGTSPVDACCGSGSWRSLSRRKGSEAALKVRKMRSTSGSLMPSSLRRVAIETVFGVSCGP